PKPWNVNDIVRDATRFVGRLIGEEVDLCLETCPDLWVARVDRGQLEQVILNLATNARDAMPNGGQLVIRTDNVHIENAAEVFGEAAASGDWVRIEIRDHGVGMDAETQARAFEPFFTTKPPGHGAGLGLAMVYGSVTQSGGFIRVTTEPDRGTTFDLHLPCAGPAPVAAGNAALGPVVLLAEDEPIVRDL